MKKFKQFLKEQMLNEAPPGGPGGPGGLSSPAGLPPGGGPPPMGGPPGMGGAPPQQGPAMKLKSPDVWTVLSKALGIED